MVEVDVWSESGGEDGRVSVRVAEVLRNEQRAQGEACNEADVRRKPL